jgi:hypothetical protein
VTQPPSGMAPPRMVSLGDREIDLEPLAARICDRYRATYPDEDERYGDAGMAWCRHDNQHILNWAIGAAAGLVDLEAEIRWLAGVLEARDFPMDRLAHDLQMAADEAEASLAPEGTAVARLLRQSAATVRER